MKFKKTITYLFILSILTQSCSFTRTMLYWQPNITDHKIFPHTELLPNDSIFRFYEGEKKLSQAILTQQKGLIDTLSLDDYLAQKTSTTAFLIIRNDTLLFEKYYRGYTSDSISKNFSISKSITSLLTGIAVDEGYIESIYDPVTKYVPELKKKDPKFQDLTIEHLLNMRAGFKFDENKLFPLSRATTLYYGNNHLRIVKNTKFKYNPGEHFEYQSLSTALLGIITEKAVNRNLSEYMHEKVWLPLGMENRATWDIDNKRNRSNRGHVGVNATAIDLAKIGRLYLNEGNWNGKQIVSADWVAKSITPNVNNFGYQYQWYSHGSLIQNPDNYSELYGYFPDSICATKYSEKYYPNSKLVEVEPFVYKNKQLIALTIYPNEQSQFAAEGILHQWIFVDPTRNIIVVRLGEKEDLSSTFIRSLIDSL